MSSVTRVPGSCGSSCQFVETYESPLLNNRLEWTADKYWKDLLRLYLASRKGERLEKSLESCGASPDLPYVQPSREHVCHTCRLSNMTTVHGA